MGIISHGSASDWALKSYKTMVNDTIANALDTIQVKTVPYNSEWNTGILLLVQKVLEEDGIVPIQEYDWNLLTVLFDRVFNNTDHDHIGIVLENCDGYIITAEGNVENVSRISERKKNSPNFLFDHLIYMVLVLYPDRN